MGLSSEWQKWWVFKLSLDSSGQCQGQRLAVISYAVTFAQYSLYKMWQGCDGMDLRRKKVQQLHGGNEAPANFPCTPLDFLSCHALWTRSKWSKHWCLPYTPGTYSQTERWGTITPFITRRFCDSCLIHGSNELAGLLSRLYHELQWSQENKGSN